MSRDAADLWTRLANDIRAVDGNHDLGAGELAHRLVERGWALAPAANETPERTEARRVAAAILDRRSADPDDDLAILARQFVRCDEARSLAPAVSPDVAVADHDDLVSLDALVTRLHGWDLPDTAELLRRVIEEVALSRALAPAARPEPPVAGTVAAIMAAGASYDVAMRAAELLAPAASETGLRDAIVAHFNALHTETPGPACADAILRLAATPPDPPT